MLRSTILGTFLTAVVFTAIAGGDRYDQPVNGDHAFTFGEKLKYRVHYGWINAGETTFEIDQQRSKVNGSECYHVVGKGYSTGAFDWFFKVRDTYESYIDENDLLSRKFLRDVNEGGFTFNNRVTFDRENHTSTTLKGSYDIPVGIHDVLSAVYYFRSFDFNQLSVNDTLPVEIFLDDQVYKIMIKYLGKETITTQLGKFKTFKVRPMLISGNVFDEDAVMHIWVSDDANKIPIRIESEILVGSIKADLKAYSGLKHQFSSRIK